MHAPQHGHMNDTNTTKTVCVLGLGAMGTAIVRALVADGHQVRVWNRTPRTLQDLGIDGSLELNIADSPTAAVSGADLAVVCVRDHTASRAVLEQIAPHLDGGVVVNVSTRDPSRGCQVGRARRGPRDPVRHRSRDGADPAGRYRALCRALRRHRG